MKKMAYFTMQDVAELQMTAFGHDRPLREFERIDHKDDTLLKLHMYLETCRALTPELKDSGALCSIPCPVCDGAPA